MIFFFFKCVTQLKGNKRRQSPYLAPGGEFIGFHSIFTMILCKGFYSTHCTDRKREALRSSGSGPGPPANT